MVSPPRRVGVTLEWFSHHGKVDVTFEWCPQNEGFEVIFEWWRHHMGVEVNNVVTCDVIQSWNKKYLHTEDV